MRSSILNLVLGLATLLGVINAASQGERASHSATFGGVPGGDDALPITPEEWGQLALGRCFAEAEDWEVGLERLKTNLDVTAESEEQLGFPERERLAHRESLIKQRRAYFGRLDFLLFGDRAKFLKTSASGFRAASGIQQPEGHSAFLHTLGYLFTDASPCGLDAFEGTLLFAIFDLPFTKAQLGKGFGTAHVFDELGDAYQDRRKNLGSLEAAYRTLRPHDSEAAFRYVDELASRLTGIASAHVAKARAQVGTERQIVDKEELRSNLQAALQDPKHSPLDRRFPDSEKELRVLVEQLGRVCRLAAEPTRIRAYLHAKIEEAEAALRADIPDRAAETLFKRVEQALYKDEGAMRRLQTARPEELLISIQPILNTWFQKNALPAVEKSLYENPFSAYWFFVQTGAVARRPHAFKGSQVSVESATFELAELKGLGLAESLRQLERKRIPIAFTEAQASLEEAMTQVTVARDVALRLIEEAKIRGKDRRGVRRYATSLDENQKISTTDLYTWMVRDANKIHSSVNWGVLRSALKTLQIPKRQKLHEKVEAALQAYRSENAENLRGYLETSGELMLELELREATERHFQQPTGGAAVGRVLSKFLISGGVPIQMWVPDGVTGEEFAELTDALTPKNKQSGDVYHGKQASEISVAHDGREYHDSLIEVIDGAKNFINISSFDWKTDQGGKEIAYRLMAKKLGVEGAGFQGFLDTFHKGLPLKPDGGSRARFYDIPTTRVKNLLFYYHLENSTQPDISTVRHQIEALLNDKLRCPSVTTCGDLTRLRERSGAKYNSKKRSDPGYQQAWEAYRNLEGLFEERVPELRRTRPRTSLAEYVRDDERLRRFVRRYGRKREDDASQPFPINIVTDGKQNLFNIHLGQFSTQFPYFFSDPVRNIYMPLLEFDARLVLWKGLLEFPWHIGPIPVPGRKIGKVVPMPFIPYPWLNRVPGFRWAGTKLSIFLQYTLAADPRAWWAMATHTKSVSNETMAMESGMGIGSKYFNYYPDFRTWHDMGVKVRGPIVGDVNDHFIEVFNQARVNNSGIPGSEGVKIPRLRYEDYRSLSPHSDPEISQNRCWVVTTHPEDGDFNYRGVFMAALAAAQKNIYIENSFFSDPLVGKMLLHKAREFRGRVDCTGFSDQECSERKREAVNIRLILPDSSDKPILDALGAADLHEMLHLGVKIYRWNPASGWSATKMLHSKAWLIDYDEGQPGLTYVGSANLTQRSHLTDNEMGIVSTSPSFAKEVYERVFHADMSGDARLENAENFHIVLSTNPVVRASKKLRTLLVSLFWFF